MKVLSLYFKNGTFGIVMMINDRETCTYFNKVASALNSDIFVASCSNNHSKSRLYPPSMSNACYFCTIAKS